jgi:hypothetical protein
MVAEHQPTMLEGLLVYFVVAKVRVTPISGLTAPRTELNGSVVHGRVISQCTISALESVKAVLAIQERNSTAKLVEAYLTGLVGQQ